MKAEVLFAVISAFCLLPSAFAQTTDTITVTATRTGTRLSDTPSSVVVLTAGEIENAATVDDALRQVPGFTLFRRTGSREANPTSQGVSLRGIGGGGGSRRGGADDGRPPPRPVRRRGGWGRRARAGR